MTKVRRIGVAGTEVNPTENEKCHDARKPLDHVGYLPQDRGVGGQPIIATNGGNALRDDN